MEKYKVIVLMDTADKQSPKYKIIKDADPLPAGYKEVLGDSSLDECVNWLSQQSETAIKWYRLTYFQYALIAAVTLTFVVVIGIGAARLAYPANIVQAEQTQHDTARIFITFLVAVGTIGVALLAVLTAMVLREYEKRFALAKEVLTILVGILGTIVGFYFGTAKVVVTDTTDAGNRPAAVPANVNANGANSNNNGASNSNSNANTANGANSRSALPYKKADGKWAVVASKL